MLQVKHIVLGLAVKCQKDVDIFQVHFCGERWDHSDKAHSLHALKDVSK